MLAWAFCPNCSQDYPKRFDLQIEIDARDTHRRIRRQCPDCEQDVTLSIGGPVIRLPEQGGRTELPGFEALEGYITDETEIDYRPRESWFVYVLECQRRRIRDREYEDWKFAAMKASKRVYVGSTDDLGRRLHEHKNIDVEGVFGAEFTRVFGPKRFLEIRSVPSKKQARAYEKERAGVLRSQHPGWFVWQH